MTRDGGPANGNGHRKIGTTPSSGATNGAKTSVAKANGNGHGKIGTTPSNGATNGAKRAVVKANGSASATSARAQVTRRPRSPKAGA